MHVFVTGGTGTIGGPVVAELIAHGHTVLALARSERSAQTLTDAGAEVLRGELADMDVLRAGAARSDGVISLAAGNDFSSAEAVAAMIAEETAAITTIADALVGSDQPFVVVSGTPWVAGRVSTEADPLPTDSVVGQRARTVNGVLALAARGVRSTAVRLPRTVHNRGTGGFAGLLTDIARRTGVAGYPGDGAQRWPAVHALDAAVLFRLALESAEPGTAWHAVSDEGDRVRDIAAVIGRRLGLPVGSRPVEEFGPFGAMFATDQPATGAHTREVLGWEPTHPGLLADLENLQPLQG